MITPRGSTSSRETLLAINAVTPEDPRNPLRTVERPRGCVDGDAIVASLSLVNAALGAGVLAYPFAFTIAGLAVASATTAILGCLSTLSLCIIMHSMQVARSKVLIPSSVSSYGDLVREELGQRASTAMEVLIVCYGFGACVGYLEVLEDVANAVTSDASLASLGVGRPTFRLISLCFAALPCFGLSCLRSIEALKYSAAASVLATLFVVATLVVQASLNPCRPSDCTDENGRHGWDRGDAGVSVWPTSFAKVVKALPLIAFALQMHIQGAAIFAAMPPRLQASVPKRRGVAGAAVALCLAFYYPTGIGGLVRFGGATEPDILNNFATSDAAANIARFCMALTALAAFPSQHFPARTILHKVWKKCLRCAAPPDTSSGLPEDELEAPPAGGLSIRFALAEATLWNASALGVAIFAVGNDIKLDLIFQLIGAIAGSSVILIIPGLLWARLGTGPPSSCQRVLPAVLLLGTGGFILVTGTVVSLQELPSLLEHSADDAGSGDAAQLAL